MKKIDWEGYSVVVPHVGREGAKLCCPWGDYLPDNGDSSSKLEHWMSLGEQTRKDFIRERDDYSCVICGRESSQVHEVTTKGSAGGEPALVPWNQMVVCQDCHTKLQQHQMEVLRWDPLDQRDLSKAKSQGCLICYGLDGHIMAQEDLDYYSRPDPNEVVRLHEMASQIEEYYKAKRANAWYIADVLSRLKDSDGAEKLGYDSHDSMLAQFGGSTAEDKRLRRVLEWAQEEKVEGVERIDPKTADKLRRKWDEMEEDERKDWLQKAQGNSASDFARDWKERFGRSKTYHYARIDGDVEVIEAEDEETIEGDCIIRLGHVVRGKDQIKGA